MERVIEMPTTYAHYRFGTEVIDKLPPALQEIIQKYRALYDIGLHGPDILFFYKPLRKNMVNRQGSLLHQRSAVEFFEHACEIIEKAEYSAASTAYIYGMICHYALDSECHPYIEKMIHKSGNSHNEVEMEFDRMLMVEDKINPIKHLSTRHVHPTFKIAKIIAPFFEAINPKRMQKILKSMIFYHKLFLAPGKLKRRLLFLWMKKVGKYEALHEIVISIEPNEKCRDYCILLKDIYTRSVLLAADLILEYQNRLDNQKELSERFNKSFGAGDEWEKLQL